MKAFNDKLALKITNVVSSMYTAYIFALLALFSLPAVLVGVVPSLSSDFPSWILKASIVALVAWIAQTFLQLVLLSIIMVGQRVQAEQSVKKVKEHVDLKHEHLKAHITKVHGRK
jgi:hypothetical protein